VRHCLHPGTMTVRGAPSCFFKLFHFVGPTKSVLTHRSLFLGLCPSMRSLFFYYRRDKCVDPSHASSFSILGWQKPPFPKNRVFLRPRIVCKFSVCPGGMSSGFHFSLVQYPYCKPPLVHLVFLPLFAFPPIFFSMQVLPLHPLPLL